MLRISLSSLTRISSRSTPILPRPLPVRRHLSTTLALRPLLLPRLLPPPLQRLLPAGSVMVRRVNDKSDDGYEEEPKLTDKRRERKLTNVPIVKGSYVGSTVRIDSVYEDVVRYSYDPKSNSNTCSSSSSSPSSSSPAGADGGRRVGGLTDRGRIGVGYNYREGVRIVGGGKTRDLVFMAVVLSLGTGLLLFGGRRKVVVDDEEDDDDDDEDEEDDDDEEEEEEEEQVAVGVLAEKASDVATSFAKQSALA